MDGSVACPECWHLLVVSFADAGPAPDVVQAACGGDVEALFRFFPQEDWLNRWTLPLVLTWGTAAQWQTIAAIWRATRDWRERRGRFLSLEEIEKGWDGGGDG